MKDTGPRHNEAFKPGCQQVLKKREQTNSLHSEPVIKGHDTFQTYFFIRIFDDKSMRDTEPRHSETFKLNCQQMLKKG